MAPVALWTPDGVRDTGMQFLGTMFGDHVKTGIGLRLTTGTVIGAGSERVRQHAAEGGRAVLVGRRRRTSCRIAPTSSSRRRRA